MKQKLNNGGWKTDWLGTESLLPVSSSGREVWDVWYSLLWLKIKQVVQINCYLPNQAASNKEQNSPKSEIQRLKIPSRVMQVKWSKAKWLVCMYSRPGLTVMSPGGQRSHGRPGFISSPCECNQPSGTDDHQEKLAFTKVWRLQERK